MVPADSDRVSPAPPYSGSHYQQHRLRLQGFHLLWPAVPGPFDFTLSPVVVVLLPRRPMAAGLGCSRFARHYFGNHCCFLLLPLLRWFSSERSPPAEAGSGGLSHSEIRGSQLLCSSPRLIAALHVLLRLSVPRHPPCALWCFCLLACTYPCAAPDPPEGRSSFVCYPVCQRTRGHSPLRLSFVQKKSATASPAAPWS